MNTHKREKVGEIGYLYRGLLIAKRDDWNTWESKYSIQDITDNILFQNHHDKSTFIEIPRNSDHNGFKNLKDAQTTIDKWLSK